MLAHFLKKMVAVQCLVLFILAAALTYLVQGPAWLVLLLMPGIAAAALIAFISHLLYQASRVTAPYHTPATWTTLAGTVLGESWAVFYFFFLQEPWAKSPTIAPANPAQLTPSALGEITRNTPPLAVVLVHGYCCNHGVWNAIQPALTQQGHAVLAIDLEPLFTSIDHYADPIEAAVEALIEHTGHSQVWLVGHSMGGLAIRAWARAHGHARAAGIVTLGTPHSGTQISNHNPRKNSKQMAYRSEWLTQLAQTESPALRQKMHIALTLQDTIVFPQHEQVLPGAATTTFTGIGHVQLCGSPQVIGWLSQTLAHRLV